MDVVGKLEAVRVSAGKLFTDLEASGTRDEKLLKALTSKVGRRLALHVCPPDCAHQVTDEFLVHASQLEQAELEKEPWFTNLVQVAVDPRGESDELCSMRWEAEAAKKNREGEA